VAIWGLLGVLALAAEAPALAQGAPPDEEQAREPGPEEDAAPEQEGVPPSSEPEIHPDVVSQYQVRLYRIRPKKLWKGLLEVLEEEGFPPEEVDANAMTVKTSFVDFNQDDYVEQVAEPPPRLGPRYPIVQMIRVKEGKVSLDAVLSKRGRSTEMRMRARILVQGVDRRRRLRVMTDRRSSGLIESTFLRTLEDRLGLERIVEED
jgi:hypothetical protein